MIPIYDANRTLRRSFLTMGLLVVNAAVFLLVLTRPDDLSLASQQALFCEYGVVPDRLLGGDSDMTNLCVRLNEGQSGVLTLITSQFLHADLLHLLGNMIFLWVFGNNIEDRLGRIRFLPFFLLCGVIAALAQSAVAPGSDVPLIGASGAISGILGAYLVLFPRVRVWTIVLPFFFLPFRLPAWLWLAIYFALQFLLLGGSATAGGGGVAYFAHIGGFVAGVALIKPFMAGRDQPPPVAPAPGTAY